MDHEGVGLAPEVAFEGSGRGHTKEVRSTGGEATGGNSALNTRRSLEMVYGTRRAKNHQRWLYLYYKFLYSRQFTTFMVLFSSQWAKNRAPGLCTFSRGPPSDRFGRAVSRSSGLCQPRRATLLTSPHPSFSSSYLSLSPLPPSHVVVCLSFFFSIFFVSHPPSQESSSLELTMFVHPFAYSSTALLVRSKDWWKKP